MRDEIYKLMDELGGEDARAPELILDELAQYLDTRTIGEFVEHFRRLVLDQFQDDDGTWHSQE
tara:strand:+ start:842 stop:1030 length:189 start_codon:yes stop_codon:yes gene_type:complete